jgi:glycerol-3-phosphate acyltransferase PlsY
MEFWITTVLVCLGAYLLGAVPVGLLVARVRGVDIRRVGSGNIGATNVFRCVGKAWGVITFLGDALKGFLAVWGGPLLAQGRIPVDNPVPAVFCMVAAVVGHNWPVYLKFKGGKGVATTAGALLGLAPAAVGIGFGVWVLVFLASRYVSVASLSAALSIIVAGWLLYLETGALLPGVLTVLGLLVVLRHHSNIRRLLKGTEHRFQFRRRQ